jgi:hypothetical protein
VPYLPTIHYRCKLLTCSRDSDLYFSVWLSTPGCLARLSRYGFPVLSALTLQSCNRCVCLFLAFCHGCSDKFIIMADFNGRRVIVIWLSFPSYLSSWLSVPVYHVMHFVHSFSAIAVVHGCFLPIFSWLAVGEGSVVAVLSCLLSHGCRPFLSPLSWLPSFLVSCLMVAGPSLLVYVLS